MYSDLNDFLADLEKRRLLARVADSVSTDLKIAAVTDRACKRPGGAPALLFDAPAGYDIPVATNVYGSNERMCLALGVEALDDLAKEIDELMTPQMPSGIMDALKMLPMVGRLRDLMPRTVKDAPCQEIVDRDGTLDTLPILKCRPARTSSSKATGSPASGGGRVPSAITPACTRSPTISRCSTSRASRAGRSRRP